MTAKAIQLLERGFNHGDCPAAFAGIDTDEGTKRLWLELERNGMVVRQTKTMRGCLGHSFSFSLLEAGKVFLNLRHSENGGAA